MAFLSAAGAAHKSSKAAVFARENLQTIKTKFADFQTKVCTKLCKNGIDTEEFRLFVKNQFSPGDCIPPAPAGLVEVFEAITDHHLWDFFHYSPLVQIVEKFGSNDSEMLDWVQTYKQDLKAFSMVTTLEDYIAADFDGADLSRANKAKDDFRYYQPIEWKADFVDHSLQYLAYVWELFSCHYLMPTSPPTALVNCIHKGCFSVTWLVPSHLIPPFIKRVQTDTEFFLRHQIVRVTVRKECIYEKPAEQSMLVSSV